MWYETALTRRLGIRYPVIQAPMAGAAASPQLVAAVSNAGGLGSLGAGYLSPEEIGRAIAEIRQLTNKPFCVNLLVVESTEGDPARIDASQRILSRYREELGIAETRVPDRFAQPFSEQLAAVLESRPPVFSFAFGIPEREAMAKFQAAGTIVMGTATNLREARALVEARVDGVVAQGSEAGGHRGVFIGDLESGMVGTIALVPEIIDAVDVPVIASGGIMDGRGLVAALALGAAAVQMGTAFLLCEQSGANAAYKKALLAASEDSTVITRAFSGRPARGVRNRFMTELKSHEDELPPYPVQNALTRDLRAAAAQQGRAEFLSLWAGQGVGMGRETTAGQLVQQIMEQGEIIVRQLHAGAAE